MCGETQLLDYFDKLCYNQFHTKPSCLFNLNWLAEMSSSKDTEVIFFLLSKKRVCLFFFYYLVSFCRFTRALSPTAFYLLLSWLCGLSACKGRSIYSGRQLSGQAWGVDGPRIPPQQWSVCCQRGCAKAALKWKGVIS